MEKGSKEYKKAQELANELVRIASYDKWYDNTLYNTYYDIFYNFLNKIENLDVFASKVAKSVYEKNFKQTKRIAYISSKQAWVLACAAIDNGIELS